MLENIRCDFVRSEINKSKKHKATILNILFKVCKNAGFRAVFLYRIAHWCRGRHLVLAAAIIERLMRHWSHCWISSLAQIGPGFTIGHVCGIIIPPGAILGKNCHVLQNSTIGGNFGKRDENGRTDPIIGDNVTIGAGAAVLGPITVGSNSIVGANATLTTSIPENSVAGAFRAEVIAKYSLEGEIIHSYPRITLSRKELFERLESLEKRMEKLEKKPS